jgi:hypothetical protein
MKITATVDVKPVETFFGQLAVVLRKNVPETIRGEVKHIIRATMRMQKHTKPADVKARAFKKGVASFRVSEGSFGGTTNVSGRRGEYGRQWMVGRRGQGAAPMGWFNPSSGKFAPLADGSRKGGTKGMKLDRSPNGINRLRAKHRSRNGWRVKDEDWAKFKQLWAKDQEDTKKRIKDRLAARGITARSWLEIIDKLQSGEAEGIPDFVRRARPISNRSRTIAGVIATGERTNNFELTVLNFSGLASATGGERKLESAISARRRFFMQQLDKGFYSDAKFVAKYHPWASVKPRQH